MKTKLLGIGDVSLSDWAASGIDNATLEEMVDVEAEGTEVVVESQAAVGTFGYWDITLPSGRTMAALDGYHLEVFRDLIQHVCPPNGA